MKGLSIEALIALLNGYPKDVRIEIYDGEQFWDLMEGDLYYDEEKKLLRLRG